MKNISKRKLLLLVIIILIVIIGLLYFSLKSKKTNFVENNINKEEQNINSYIGHIYPPDPEGVISDINKDSNLGGASIMMNNGSEFSDHGLQMAKTPNGYELWLDKVIDRDNNGKPINIIKDSLLISNEEISSYVFGGLCGKEDQSSLNVDLVLDSKIVAYVDIQEYYLKGRAQAIRAWKINLETEKYEVYSPDGVFCIDPSYGTDTD